MSVKPTWQDKAEAEAAVIEQAKAWAQVSMKPRHQHIQALHLELAVDKLLDIERQVAEVR